MGPPPAPPQQALNLVLQPATGGALGSLAGLIASAGATVQATGISRPLRGPGAGRGDGAAVGGARRQPGRSVRRRAPRPSASPTRPTTRAISTTPSGISTAPWGINAPGAWSVTSGSSQVVVADTDTGIAYNQPELVNNLWLNQAEIPSSVRPNLTDINGDGLITFTDLNNSVNQGSGKITATGGVVNGSSVLASLEFRRLVQRLDPGRRHRASQRPDRLELRRQHQQPHRPERPRHVHRRRDRCRRQQRHRGDRRRLVGADHGRAVPRLLGQRVRLGRRRRDRVRGQPRRQGDQRELGRQRRRPRHRRGDPVRRPVRRDHRRRRRQQRLGRRQQQHVVLAGVVLGQLSQPDHRRGHRHQRQPGRVLQLRRPFGPARRAGREPLRPCAGPAIRHRQRHVDGRAPGHRDGRAGGGGAPDLVDDPGDRRGPRHDHARSQARRAR